MKKNSLRYKALKKCAAVNENIAIDLLKLKRNGVNVKKFIKAVEHIDAPYSILENYNFMSLDDVDYRDVRESLMTLGASRKLLSEAVVSGDLLESKNLNPVKQTKFAEKTKKADSKLSKEEIKKRQAELDKIVDEIKADTDLDKKSAKKYTTRLKKIKNLKDLKKAKSIIKKLSKVYPEAADILNETLVLKVVRAAKKQQGVLNENMRINNFSISSYSLKELKECYNKVEKNIRTLNRQIRRCSLNESYTASDIRKLKENLKKQTTLLGKLDEEISWKMLILSQGGLDKVNALLEGEESKEEKKSEDAASDSLDDLFNNIGDEMEDNLDKETDDKDDDKDDDKEKDSDDEDVELDSITITMKSEDAANGLKDALIEKGVPEDAIEIEAVEDEDEVKNESKKYSNKFMKLFEDEDLSESDDEESDDNKESDDSSDDNEDKNSDDDKAYNVTLTDTDYVNSLKDVMVDEYGYTEDEFWDSIGGKPVEDEEDDDKDSDKDDEDEKDSDKDDEDEDTSELDSIGADIFGDQ